MSERTDLLRAMHKARKEGNLQTFLNDLTEERFAMMGRT